MITFKACKIDGCDRHVVSLGLCGAHYMRLKRHGDPLAGSSIKLPKNSQGGKCKIDGCFKHSVAFNLCCTHYSKFKKYGDPLAGRANTGSKCAVEGCDKPSEGLSFCHNHYVRFKKYGNPLLVAKVTPNTDIATYVKIEKQCLVDGCDRKSSSLGYCKAHYGRFKRYGDPLSGGSKRALSVPQSENCKVEGCDKPSHRLSFCAKHYTKFKKYGDPLAGMTQDGRSKEWRISKTGYVYRCDGNSPYACGASDWVMQHRQVMGEHIGRPLLPTENVHHKNGIRSDNRLENLELWSKSQPAGQRVADKVKWAREIIDLYGNLDIV